MQHHPKVWPLQEAKARFSELVRLAQTDGPQTVTVRGKPMVVITRAEEESIAPSSLTGADMIRAFQSGSKFELDVPARPKNAKFREVKF